MTTPGDTPKLPGKGSGTPKVLFTDQPEELKNAPAKRTPRKLFSNRDPAPEPERESRTPKKPAVLFGGSPVEPPTLSGPKVVRGSVRRQRIPCSANDLLTIDPRAIESEIRSALLLIEGVNLDDAFFEDVFRFGAELQAEHAAITESEVLLANDSVLHQGQKGQTRMLLLLEELRPDRLFPVTTSVWTGILKAFAPPVPPSEIFRATYPDLLLVAQGLHALESSLSRLIEQLGGLDRRYQLLSSSLRSYILAATFLVSYVRSNSVPADLQTHYASQADALEQRVSSLVATQVTIEAGRMTNTALRTSVHTLLGIGRSMLEEDLPAFQTAYSVALTAAAQSKNLAANVDLLSVRDVHARLIGKLQGEKK